MPGVLFGFTANAVEMGGHRSATALGFDAVIVPHTDSPFEMLTLISKVVSLLHLGCLNYVH